MGPCSCAPRDASRTARNTVTGAWWRTSATSTVAWCSVKCCTWARSTTVSARPGADRSRCCGGILGSAPMALFAADREAPELDCEVVRINVKDLSLHRPRKWGACWLALTLWDRLWGPRLRPSRQGTRWLDVLKTLVCYQLIDPGSEWRLHRHWYEHSAMRDLLGSPMGVIGADTLYRCLDAYSNRK